VSERRVRVRRSKEESRAEILRAGAQLLEDGGFAALTVRDVMTATSVGRSTFYLYFPGIGELAVAILDELIDELFAGAGPWLDRDGAGGPPAIRQSIRAVVGVWATKGRLLAALAEASRSERVVGDIWERKLIDPFVEAVTSGMRAGTTVPDTDRPEVARALIRMNEAYLVDRFGKDPPTVTAERASAALTDVWVRTLYAPAGAP
jgi:AcrR family transcriptional regulator